jgi:cobalt/nickel transport system permease protein
MHIPDGFLSVPVSAACAGLSTAALGAAAFRAHKALGPRAVAMAGVTAAFVFAAQMLNFPVAGGTSGHLIGGVLAAVMLGPSMALVVMTAVLILQCFVFGDGGMLSLGANVLNMAVVHPFVGYAIYRLVLGRHTPRALHGARAIAAIAFASWTATVVAAATCAGELALSRVAAPLVVLSAMVGVHSVIGLGEAAISALVLAALIRLRPELVDRAGRSASSVRVASVVVPGLVAALALVLFVSPFACTWPDGLEHVVQRLGISPAGVKLSLSAPLQDYAVPGIGSGVRTTALAGALGTLLVFGACVVLGLVLSPRRMRDEPKRPRS